MIYRCAAFEARVRHVTFSQLIQFTESLPPTALRAMTCNNRLPILFDALLDLVAIQMYSLLQPWLSLCWSQAASENGMQWFYAAPRTYTLDWRVHHLDGISAILQRFGYYELKDVYAMIEDERKKGEIAGMFLAVRSSAKWTNSLLAELS